MLSAALAFFLSQTATTDESAIRKVIGEFRIAVEAKDAKKLGELFWPEAVVFEHGSVDKTASDFVGKHMVPHFKVLSFKWLDEENSGRADVPLAYVAQRATLEVREATGAVKHVPNTFTFVLRKKDAAWRIAHLHWSLGKGVAAVKDGGS